MKTTTAGKRLLLSVVLALALATPGIASAAKITGCLFPDGSVIAVGVDGVVSIKVGGGGNVTVKLSDGETFTFANIAVFCG